jgi:hypothetical protein
MTVVTKEEVDKARAIYAKAADADTIAAAATIEAAIAAADEAWDKYRKLKREYEDGN